jgi:hypothetical protein
MRNHSEKGLSSSESRDLRCIAGIMIPPSEEFGVPGADDAIIFDDIMTSLGRDLAQVREALGRLSALGGGGFADLDETRRQAVAETFLRSGGTAIAVLGRAILQCYYRDDRVMRSLGMEPRPPFPLGHKLEQGDWSLLDVVRTRPKMWRDAP